MKGRGKGQKWTIEECREVLNGGNPSGKTPAQIYTFRYRFEKHYGSEIFAAARKLLKKIEFRNSLVDEERRIDETELKTLVERLKMQLK